MRASEARKKTVLAFLNCDEYPTQLFDGQGQCLCVMSLDCDDGILVQEDKRYTDGDPWSRYATLTLPQFETLLKLYVKTGRINYEFGTAKAEN